MVVETSGRTSIPNSKLSTPPGAVVHPKNAMCDAVFLIFTFIDLKTAMHNLFIFRTGRYTHGNNYIGRGHILYDIYESEIDSNI